MTETPKKVSPFVRALFIALAVIFFAGGGYFGWRGNRGGSPKLVLVGMDALTWDIMDPLLARGRLPHFQKLIQRGAHGELQTMRSTYISASIWTTILTGKHPKHHGIEGFFSSKGYAVNSTDRTTKFLPLILSDQGISSATVGFWATWPAEEVNGCIVSDLASYGRFKDSSPSANENIKDYTYLKQIKKVTWPEDLLDEIMPVMKNPDDIPRKTYEKILPMDDALWDQFSKTQKISRQDQISLIKFSVVTDLNFHLAGMKILEDHHPEAYMVYFQGPDIMEHFFWGYMEPRYFDHISKADADRFGEVIRNYYIFMDELLGEIMAHTSENTLIVVCSDHGQKRVRFFGQDNIHTGEHRLSKPPGIYIMAGPGIKNDPDEKINGPVVYDIVPTILYLLHLPIGKDMDGKVDIQVIDDNFKNNNTLDLIETYDSNLAEKKQELSPLDDEFRARLRAIGYIDQ